MAEGIQVLGWHDLFSSEKRGVNLCSLDLTRLKVDFSTTFSNSTATRLVMRLVRLS